MMRILSLLFFLALSNMIMLCRPWCARCDDSLRRSQDRHADNDFDLKKENSKKSDVNIETVCSSTSLGSGPRVHFKIFERIIFYVFSNLGCPSRSEAWVDFRLLKCIISNICFESAGIVEVSMYTILIGFLLKQLIECLYRTQSSSLASIMAKRNVGCIQKLVWVHGVFTESFVSLVAISQFERLSQVGVSPVKIWKVEVHMIRWIAERNVLLNEDGLYSFR